MTSRPVITLNRGVKMPFAPAGMVIVAALVMAAKATGLPILVTSGSEECGRLATDPHMTGEAVDIGVVQLSVSDTLALKSAVELAFKEITSAPFTVLYECRDAPTDPRLIGVAYVNPKATGPHIHIQRAMNTQYLALA